MDDNYTAECLACDIIFKISKHGISVCPKCGGGFYRILTRPTTPYCTCESPFGCEIHGGETVH